jgi:hypothetical protein
MMNAHDVVEYPLFSEFSPNRQGRAFPGLAQGEDVVLISSILFSSCALYIKRVLSRGVKQLHHTRYETESSGRQYV